MLRLLLVMVATAIKGGEGEGSRGLKKTNDEELLLKSCASRDLER